ncbi:TPA: DUF190 domain-containing protein [Citrobacter koseri]
MQGYQITFYTQQDRMHGNTPLSQFLLDEAKRHGIRGATLNAGVEGIGHDGAVHAVNLFDLSDQPVQVTLVISEDEMEKMMINLKREKIKVFYVKISVEFDTLGLD